MLSSAPNSDSTDSEAYESAHETFASSDSDSDSKPKSKITSEKKKPKKIVDGVLYIDASSPEHPASKKDVKLSLHNLHDLLDSQSIPITDSQGKAVEEAIISGPLDKVLLVAHGITNHGKPDLVTVGEGKDEFKLQGKVKASEFEGLDPSEKNRLLLEKEGALEPQGGKPNPKRRRKGIGD